MSRSTAQITLVNRRGLHARASGAIVRTAMGFESVITVSANDAAADGRSIMDLLMLGAAQGDTLEITAEGADVQACLQALLALVADGFGERD